jgi:hypothetical protein
MGTLLDQNFDGVTPPALPSGWVATNAQGPPPLWVTSNSGVPMPPAYSPPNAAFIDDPGTVSDKRLDSPSFFHSKFEIWSQLTFRHNFNFEASSEDPTLGFDGGVLESSTDGGNTFQYVPAGSFVNGGYNHTISTNRGSPIAGLQAWSGNSKGFITATVNLPFGFKSVLRWRMASDTSGSSDGWRVDDVVVTECHIFGTPTATPTPTVPQSPTPTATATLTPTPTVSATVTPTATATATPTATVTPTATATATARPTPTARPNVTPRQRPTAPPRP